MRPWSFAGAGQSGASSAPSPFRPGRWGWLLIWTGALTLVSMTPIGHVAAILSLVSIIGIPLYFLLAALPSIFLILLFLRLVLGAIDNARAGAAVWVAVFTASALFIVYFFVVRAHLENAKLDARAAALVASDMDSEARVPAGRTFAIIRSDLFPTNRERIPLCDDLCQRLLLNGSAKRVLAVTLAPGPGGSAGRHGHLPSLEPAPGLSGVMYWLEPRASCPDANIPDNVRLLRVDEPRRGSGLIATRSASEAMRVKNASGTCLVSAPSTLDQADDAFFYGPVARGRSGRVYGFDAGVDTVAAWRTAYYQRSGNDWTIRHRATGVRYLRFPGVLIPTYVHGPELRIYNGYLRSARLLGAREKHLDEAPVAETLSQLGVSLRIDDIGRSEGPKIIDGALAAKGDLSPMQTAILEDYLGRVSANRQLRLAPEDVRRILALAADARVPFNWNAQGAVTLVAEQQPQLAPEIARILFARLSDLVDSASVVTDRADRSVASVSNALAALPAATLKPYFTNIEAVANSPGLRGAASALIARLDVFGAFAAPAIFRVIDDSLDARAPGRNNWSGGFGAGLRALCRLGGEGAFARPMLEERIRRDPSPFVITQERLTIVGLIRLGAGENDIRELLGFNEKQENRMRFALRAANSQRPCE
jgi:hypothetical protein